MNERILIADDEPSVRQVVSRALSAAGWETITAGDGRQALDAAKQERPDLILLDVEMPQLDGTEVLQRLRRTPENRLTPVIFLTSRNAVEDEIAGLDLGADDYIGKPFNCQELTARVGSALRRHREDLCANPLTGLPGSPTIEAEVNSRIETREPFAFFYADIDDFKAYNDAYGFRCGDNAIANTAAVLRRALDVAQSGFLGHIGGDDFVALCGLESAQVLGQKMADLFDEAVSTLYHHVDQERGFIKAVDRQGRLREVPLMTLTIAGVTTRTRCLHHYGKVVSIASEVKNWLKRQPAEGRSRCVFDRRHDA